MKQFIFTQEEAISLVQRLTVCKQDQLDRTPKENREDISDIHRKYHYEVVQWLHNIGVDRVTT